MTDTDFVSQLEQRKQQHLYRRRVARSHSVSNTTTAANRTVINFCSNDYLSLSQDQRIKQATIDAIDRYGVGSTASQLICGYTAAHQALEEAFAEFTGYPRALFFANGYTANVGIQTALFTKDTVCLHDRDNHASLLDGSRFSQARLARYRHLDLAHLQTLLNRYPDKNKQVISDAVFSMTGEIADAALLATICRQNNASLIVDNAHSIGVLGKTGAGITEHYCLTPNDVPLLISPLGKGFAAFGAMVCGNEDTIEMLIQFARSLIYSTAPPPALAAANLAALNIIRKEHWRREKLNENIAHFISIANQKGLPIGDSPTAIQTLIVGESQDALSLSNALFDGGYWVTAMRPPTVAHGNASLRITLNIAHEKKAIEGLIDTICKHM